MKEGNQISDSAQSTRRRRKRRGMNFSGSRQRQQRVLKRKKSLVARGSKSSRKPSGSRVDEQGRS